MNIFLDSLLRETNYAETENGAITHSSTSNSVLDLFALGGSYRKRDKNDCVLLFKNAYEENADLAVKCLFYLRDIEQGQGERRFFRICYNWLCNEHPEVAIKNMDAAVQDNFARLDDIIYSAIDTKCEDYLIKLIKQQLNKDLYVSAPSLLAKWLPSANASSKTTKAAANKIRKRLGYTQKEYRKLLSLLRTKINIIEKLLTEGKYDEIDFSKIPSKAGLKYRNVFITKEELAQRYKEFMSSKETKVNAATIYSQDIVSKILGKKYNSMSETEINTFQKYWENLKDIYNGKKENAIAVVDVSGSMYPNAINSAVGLGAYIAERCGGDFKDHFITFSEEPTLVKFKGVNIVDKVTRAVDEDWGYNTNIESVFDLLLETAIKNNISQEDMISRLYILSDMEFDRGLRILEEKGVNTLLEGIAKKWKECGYDLPQLVFWNLDARNDNIPATTGGRFVYVSGNSQNIIEAVLSNKSGIDLMLEKLNSSRYKKIGA